MTEDPIGSSASLITRSHTYVATWAGFVYVAFCFDVFSRMITGWQASRSMTTDLALDALEMGIWQRQRQGHSIHGLVHHSDAGSRLVTTMGISVPTTCGERLPSGLGSVLIAGLRWVQRLI